MESQLARVYDKKEKTEASEALLRQVSSVMTENIGPTRPDTLLYKINLALVIKIQWKI